MNVIEEAFVVEAQTSLELAMIDLENHADNGPPALVGDAYRKLLQLRGHLAALRQMTELQAIERAKTEPPILTVVR